MKPQSPLNVPRATIIWASVLVLLPGICVLSAQQQPDQQRTVERKPAAQPFMRSWVVRSSQTAPQQVAPQDQKGPVARPGYAIVDGREVPRYVPPGLFTMGEMQLKNMAIEHKIRLYPTAQDRAKETNGRWITAYLNPANGQWYGNEADKNGDNLLDPSLVDLGSRITRAVYIASWELEEIIDREHPNEVPSGHRTVRINKITGEVASADADKPTPLPKSISRYYP